VRAEARGLLPHLPLDADDAAQDEGQSQQFQLQQR